MELGFETTGSPTLICYDSEPILVTDPWLWGPAFFGSWTLSHRIPEEQMTAIKASRFVWISHGHPDHLSLDSLLSLQDKQILVSDHVGARIYEFLVEAGFSATILPDRRWVELSDRIRVQSLAHYNQDSILLIDIDGTLLINMNDTPSTVWGSYIRRVARHYEKVVLLRLSGRPDGDMNNFFDESGRPIRPPDEKRVPNGTVLSGQMKALGANVATPFSSMHHYQRTDSVWANALVPDLAEYGVGFDERVGEVLPAFISYDVLHGRVAELNPEANPREAVDPKTFGDDWGESLSKEEERLVHSYFERRPLLGKRLDFLRLVVGGEEHVIRWSTSDRSGVTFEVPRASLLTAVTYEIFDDLFLGNFMKTTLHGRLRSAGLSPAVNPYLGKWADNGRARSQSEVADYLKQYSRQAPLANLLGRVDGRAKYAIRAHVTRESAAYDFLRRIRRRIPA